ncbi:MAG: (Fe-S)-binding protein [Bacillota bacterium]
MRVSLFITCLSDMFFPNVGEAVVRLLKRHGVQVDFPMEQTCCGQPAFNSGFHDEARQMARQWVKAFERAEYVVTPSGSCAAMVRTHYPDLLPESREIASRTYEFTQFLVDVLKVEDLGAKFKARAAYHHSCHMRRELGIYHQPLTLLRHVEGLELVEVPRGELCCGFGGTFSVKMPEISEAMVSDKVSAVASTGADILVGSDSSCIMNIGGRMSREGRPIRVMHTAELLWEGVRNRG